MYPPRRFSLRSWEQLSKELVTFYPGVRLYEQHINLKNAFWSFVLTELARTIFRSRSGPSRRFVDLGRLPFEWKCSPFIRKQTLARMVERVLPPDILPVHYLDDFLLVHHDKGYLWDNTGNAVFALGREGSLLAPRVSLSLPLSCFSWGNVWICWRGWCGHMRLPTCKCLWRGFGWRCAGRRRGLYNLFWDSFNCKLDQVVWHALLRRGPIVGLMRNGLGTLLWLYLSPWLSYRR